MAFYRGGCFVDAEHEKLQAFGEDPGTDASRRHRGGRLENVARAGARREARRKRALADSSSWGSGSAVRGATFQQSSGIQCSSLEA